MNEEAIGCTSGKTSYVEKQINWEDVIAIIDTLHYPTMIRNINIDAYNINISYKTPTL